MIWVSQTVGGWSLEGRPSPRLFMRTAGKETLLVTNGAFFKVACFISKYLDFDVIIYETKMLMLSLSKRLNLKD